MLVAGRSASSEVRDSISAISFFYTSSSSWIGIGWRTGRRTSDVNRPTRRSGCSPFLKEIRTSSKLDCTSQNCTVIDTVFYARQHICYSAYMPRQFRLSVRPSVTRVYCIKAAKCIIEILSLSDRPIIIVFRHQESLRNSDSFTPNWGAKYKGNSNFRQYAAMSRKGY